MGRELKRVPLDFDYPLKHVWVGYLINTVSYCNDKHCEDCQQFAKIKGIPKLHDGSICHKYDEYFKEVQDKLNELCEPPKGEGYQLWNTTSNGSPVSPVFQTLDELCEWCEQNATTFANYKASKDEWKQMLDGGIVAHKEGNFVFI